MHLLEDFSDAVFTLDLFGKIRTANAVFSTLLEHEKDLLKDRMLMDFVPAASRAGFATLLHSAAQGEIRSVNCCLLTDSFRYLNVSLTLVPVIHESRVLGLQGIIKGPDQLYQPDQYKSIFDISPIACWIFDTETLSFLDVNEAAVKQYGYSREEFLSMTIRDIRPPEDVPELQQILETIVPGDFNRAAVRHLKKSGELISVSTEGVAFRFSGRDARLVMAIDITAQEKADQALLRSEQRFKGLIQEGSDLIALIDPTGNYIYTSPATERTLGYAAEQLNTMNVFELVHPEDRARVEAQFNSLPEKGQTFIAAYRVVDKNKEYKWLETIATDSTDNPALGALVINSRDVTHRIGNELKIRESMEQYNLLSRATSDAFYDWTLKDNVVKWSNGLKGAFGHKKDRYSRDWWENHIHPEDLDRVLKTVSSQMRNKRLRIKNEYRIQGADGDYKFVLDRACIVYTDKGLPVRIIGAIEDISEKVKYIRNIESQNKKLLDISWMQSHLVRAPLTKVMALTDLLKLDAEDESNQQVLNYLSQTASELDAVIRKIIQETESA